MADQPKNIIVLLLDTVRASDVYGNKALSTMNRLAKSATSYRNAVAPGTWTAPTHAALFTNRRVSQIRQVSRNFLKGGTYKIDPWLVKTKFIGRHSMTMAHRLQEYGYESILLSNNPFVTSFTNLGMGFNSVHDIWRESNVKYNKGLASKISMVLSGGSAARAAMMQASYLLTRILPRDTLDKLYLDLRKRLSEGVSKADGTHRLDRGANDTNKILEDYLSYKYNYKPHFLFLNYMEAHENYPVGRKGMTQDKWVYLSGLEEMDDYSMNALHRGYLRRLKYLDNKVKRTIEILKERGMLENATVIITSDHGQLFGEHGMLYHSMPPYEGIAKVPLIAANYSNGKLEKIRDSVENPVSLSSLHDAILNLAVGRFDYLNGNLRRDRYVICEHMGISEGWDEKLLRMLAPRSRSAAQILKAKQKHNRKVTAVYGNGMKLLHYFGKRKDQLYNTEKDPSESDNIIDANRALALRLARSLSAHN
jgi:arylsulfatase A-like enzyme